MKNDPPKSYQINVHNIYKLKYDALVYFCKMTTTRYGVQATTYPHFISINARIIQAIASSNYKHDNNHRNDGVVAIAKTKSKTHFTKHFARILILILVSFTFADMVHAGTCWAKRTQTGKCKHPMERNVSKEKCCGGGDDVGFIEKEMSDFEYFFATALGDGTTCSSCIDSCKTAKCGIHKKCMMRAGEPKCVCAPKCKTKNQRPIRLNRHAHVQSNDQTRLNRRSGDAFNRTLVQNQSGQSHHQSIQIDADTSRDVQIFHTDNLNRSNTKSDKIVSIIAPILQLNLSSSHRSKKLHGTVHGTAHSGRRSVVKSTSNVKHLAATNSPIKQRQSGNSYRHQHSQNNQYGNSSLLDNSIAKVEEQIKSNFYGHDIPYPPIDLPKQLYDNNQFHRAVCGTDGKTYKTECQLKRRACRQESTSLSVAYKGQCKTSCKHVQCPVGQHCLEDQNLMPHCVTCSITCPPYDPAVKSVISNPARLVCGVDGNTYRNLCEIKRTACMLGRSIPVAYRGTCRESASCDTVRCKDRQVCLSDLMTHRPRCVSCSFKCPRRKRPKGQQSAFIKICGMNNKSYHSWCQMMRDSCNTGYYIDVKHNGVCQNSTLNGSH